MKATDKISGLHQCPLCAWQCSCDNHPCSCCSNDNDLNQDNPFAKGISHNEDWVGEIEDEQKKLWASMGLTSAYNLLFLAIGVTGLETRRELALRVRRHTVELIRLTDRAGLAITTPEE